MKYNDFKKQVLNKLGNLRRIEQSLNSSDNNKVKEINGIKFNSYKQITERENDIINTIIDEIM